MVVYVLILAFLWEGEIQFAVYNGGTPHAYEFKTKAACERERDRQLGQMDKILNKEATLVKLDCIQRTAEGGA